MFNTYPRRECDKGEREREKKRERERVKIKRLQYLKTGPSMGSQKDPLDTRLFF